MGIRLFFVVLFLAPLAAQRSSSFQDLAQPLAGKIAAALAPGDQVRLTWAADEGDAAALLPVDAEIRRALAGRGVRTVESGGTIVLPPGCSRTPPAPPPTAHKPRPPAPRHTPPPRAPPPPPPHPP